LVVSKIKESWQKDGTKDVLTKGHGFDAFAVKEVISAKPGSGLR
jgi:hypothetical protein